MTHHFSTQSAAPSPAALTAEQAERVRVALRSAAGEYAPELTIEELEDRIMPGLNATN